MKPRLALLLALFVVGCTTKTVVTEEEEEEEVQEQELKSAPIRADNNDLEAAACSTVATRKACELCCDFNSSNKDECVAKAKCETRPAARPDCRTDGC